MDFKVEYVTNKLESDASSPTDYLLKAYLKLPEEMREPLEKAYPEVFDFPEVKYAYSKAEYYISSPFSNLNSVKSLTNNEEACKLLRLYYVDDVLFKIEIIPND